MNETYRYLLGILDGKDAKTTHRGAITTVTKDQNGVISVHLYSTRIIEALPDGSIVLKTGGWSTATTKSRLNEFLQDWKVFQQHRRWYIQHRSGRTVEWERDVVRINADGSVNAK